MTRDLPGSVIDEGPMTFGQLSVWRDIEGLPKERWHEANNFAVFDLADGVPASQVEAALAAVETQHPSLRTCYRATESARPRQVVLQPRSALALPRVRACDISIEKLTADLMAIPFRLTSERPWRAAVVWSRTDDAGEPLAERVVFVKHHIAADAVAVDLIREAFLRQVSDPQELTEPAYDLVALAQQQRSAAWEQRRAATTRHFTRLVESPAAQLRVDGIGVLQVSLESDLLYRATVSAAAELSTTNSTVVLAAVGKAVAAYCSSPEIRMGVVASNRYSATWIPVVTSLTQLAIFPMDGTLDLSDMATGVAAESMRLFRAAMYDVDAMTPSAMGHPSEPDRYAPTAMFNYITPARRELGENLEPGTRPEPRWEEAFSVIGLRCYLRVFETDSTIRLRLRMAGLSRAATEDILLSIHDNVLALSQPAQQQRRESR